MTTTDIALNHTRTYSCAECATTWTVRVAVDGADIWPSSEARKHAESCIADHGPIAEPVSVANFVALDPPAWANRIREYRDGSVSYDLAGSILVPVDGCKPQGLQLSTTLDLETADGKLQVLGVDEEPIIMIEQTGLTVDEARAMIAALTELVEAYDKAVQK